MAVYKDVTVPVPERGVILHKDRRSKSTRVEYITDAPYDPDKQYTKPKRILIGHLIDHDKEHMHPNSNYKKVFPLVWEKYTDETVVPDTLKIGLFCLYQAIDYDSELIKILDDVLGEKSANDLLDYSMFSLAYHSDVTSSFSGKMEGELLYNNEPKSDSSYSRLFGDIITDKHILMIRKEWACYCKEMGVEEVWLYIDGSNVDCKAKGVTFGEKGKAKSGKNVNIISFTCAVAPDGMPVTYKAYRGSQVDAKGLQEIIDFLKECGIRVAGIIVDRGYCSASAMQYLQENGIDYIIMCKANPKSFKEISVKCGNEIKNNILYWVWFTNLFAKQKTVKVFDSLEKEDTLTLFYDLANGSQRVQTLLNNLSDELRNILAQINAGKKPVISAEYKDWIELTTNEEGKLWPTLKNEKIQSVMDEKGLYGIICSLPLEPSLVHTLYQSRSVSEVYFSVMKTQLGYYVMRTHSDEAVQSKFLEAFITSICHWYVEKACKKSGFRKGVNAMIAELEKLGATKINETYVYSHTAQDKVKKFLSVFGVDAEDLLNDCVKIKNDRVAGRYWIPRNHKPGPKKGSHHKRYDEQGNEIKKKRGPKPGFKMGPVNKDGSTRKKPGVPKGTKRGKYNKDGSLRKKPGPKRATASGGI